MAIIPLLTLVASRVPPQAIRVPSQTPTTPTPISFPTQAIVAFVNGVTLKGTVPIAAFVFLVAPPLHQWLIILSLIQCRLLLGS
ncbi:hypothetical protein L3X38_032993 [Prunus dulcis]|uniref:Uncharacterized protein n=1 Tax=Prunus dulcis TaxID=3755 RepID=A0AAD4YWF6_PRUDU|nr:hypothetical protein L3X38_032993 [Prunus dulcis]